MVTLIIIMHNVNDNNNITHKRYTNKFEKKKV